MFRGDGYEVHIPDVLIAQVTPNEDTVKAWREIIANGQKFGSFEIPATWWNGLVRLAREQGTYFLDAPASLSAKHVANAVAGELADRLSS